MTGAFFGFHRSTLPALAQRTQARYRGAYDSHTSTLVRQVEPRLLGQWGASPLEVIRWHWPGEGRGALILLNAKPINGPLSTRLLGLFQPTHPEEDSASVMLLGPIRWEVVFEARLVSPTYRQWPQPARLAGTPVRVLGRSNNEVAERVHRAQSALVIAFLATEAHLMHLGPEGAWFLTPDLPQTRARDRVFTLLTHLRAHYMVSSPRAATPPMPALVSSR